ncbi:MAG: AAA family ATPase, partial [Deltaproteobacteria bacterium]|nr:AAA family ATPase [Deltaproteobacteria bacterium]
MTAPSSRAILAVDGIDGSGKSTFAHALLARLRGQGCEGVIVSVDDFRRPIDWAALDRPEVDVYFDSYYDLALAERCLREFIAGAASVTIPRYDLMTERIDGTRELGFAGAHVAIVEGVFPLRIPAVVEGVVIYLEASEAEVRRRIIARDTKKRRTREETEARIDRRYFPSQERYRALCAPRDRADVVIDNEDPTAPRAVRRELARAAEPLRSLLDR